MLWVFYVMDELTAEPKPVVVRPFTRFEMRRMDSSVRAFEHYGIPARFDAVREEVVNSWISHSAAQQ